MRWIGKCTQIARWKAAVVLVALLWSCASESGDGQGRRDLSCFVSVLPQAYFVERISGGIFDGHVLVGPGQSPATYEPTPRQLALLADSPVYFAIGVPFESQLLPRIRANFPSLHVVETQAGVPPRRALERHRTDVGVASNHVDQGVASARLTSGHAHGESDPHVWLDPQLAKKICENIRDALARIDPDRANQYELNYRALATDLDELDRKIEALLAPYRGRDLLVFHPAYGYFADAYGLTQVAIETGGVTAGTKHLSRIIDRAKAGQVTAVFVQPQFSSTAAQTIADEIGARVVMLDPLAKDYVNNLNEMAKEIAAAMAPR